MTVTDWRSTAAAKQASTKSSIPVEWILENVPSAEEEPNSAAYLDSLLPEEEVAITSSTLKVLADQIAAGKLSSLEVIKAFCHRAALAHQMLNCCTEIFFDKAYARAKELDEYYAEKGTVVGPLHGIPISLKDQVNLPGMDTSLGYVALLNKPKTQKDKSLIALQLENLGAVFYVKTTVPMAMMSGDTYSNAFGYTQNAIKRSLSAGGSSGGEGALIASKASGLGFGTDIGGSIRVPAAFNGLYALRPSFGRLSYYKVDNSYSGQPIIPSVIGPLAQDLDDLELVTKSLISSEAWKYDPKIVPIPWREYQPGSDKLSFGIMETDGINPVDPPIKRALDTVAKALNAAGHETIPWEAQQHQAIFDTVKDIFTADAGKEVEDLCAITGEPNTVRDLTVAPKAKTVGEAWDLADRKYELQKMYFDYWNDTSKRTTHGAPVDAWIAPVWNSTSSPHYQIKMPTYTMAINLLDCSVLIVPVTEVSKEIDSEKTDKYDPEIFHGAPVCVQVITRRLEEEKAIYLGKLLRDSLKNLS